MKNRLSVIRLAITACVTAAVCLVAPWDIASAQSNPANPSGVFPGPGSMPPGAPSVGKAPVLPYGANEVVKMYQGGINKDVIVNYIGASGLPFHLSADGIIYLQSLGVPQDITKAMLQRDGQLQQQQASTPFNPQQPMPGAMPPPYGAYGDMSAQQPPVQVVQPSTPAPPVTDYSDYGYDYPYQYYYNGWPYYYWPLVGGGWGWGWGYYGGYRGGYHGGFRGGFGGFHGGVGGFHGGVGGFHGGIGGGGFHGGVGVGGFHGGGSFGGVHGGGGFGGHSIGGGGGHGGGGGGHR